MRSECRNCKKGSRNFETRAHNYVVSYGYLLMLPTLSAEYTNGQHGAVATCFNFPFGMR